MVVLIVLSILAALAGFTYSETQGALSSSSTKSVVLMVAQAEQRFSIDYSTYTSYGPDLSMLVDRGITLTNGTSTGPFVVSLALGTDGTLGIAVQATGSGACESASVAPLSVGGSTSLTSGVVTTSAIPTSTGCTGANALPSGDLAQTPTSQKF
jgi:Tfp pilus assembly protein PilE